MFRVMAGSVVSATLVAFALTGSAQAAQIPGHAGKTWQNKRKGTVVKYYVTATSKTPGIAYDISAHAFEPGIPAPKTVLVLHIPEKRIPEPRQEPKK